MSIGLDYRFNQKEYHDKLVSHMSENELANVSKEYLLRHIDSEIEISEGMTYTQKVNFRDSIIKKWERAQGLASKKESVSTSKVDKPSSKKTSTSSRSKKSSTVTSSKKEKVLTVRSKTVTLENYKESGSGYIIPIDVYNNNDSINNDVYELLKSGYCLSVFEKNDTDFILVELKKK